MSHIYKIQDISVYIQEDLGYRLMQCVFLYDNTTFQTNQITSSLSAVYSKRLSQSFHSRASNSSILSNSTVKSDESDQNNHKQSSIRNSRSSICNTFEDIPNSSSNNNANNNANNNNPSLDIPTDSTLLYVYSYSPTHAYNRRRSQSFVDVDELHNLSTYVTVSQSQETQKHNKEGISFSLLDPSPSSCDAPSISPLSSSLTNKNKDNNISPLSSSILPNSQQSINNVNKNNNITNKNTIKNKDIQNRNTIRRLPPPPPRTLTTSKPIPPPLPAKPSHLLSPSPRPVYIVYHLPRALANPSPTKDIPPPLPPRKTVAARLEIPPTLPQRGNNLDHSHLVNTENNHGNMGLSPTSSGVTSIYRRRASSVEVI
ncbi:hypothetical protein WA158_003663 [Blastocystis sp. Blastoise]